MERSEKKFTDHLILLRNLCEDEFRKLGNVPILCIDLEDDLSAQQHKELTEREAKSIRSEIEILRKVEQSERHLKEAEEAVICRKIELIQAYQDGIKHLRINYKEKEALHTRLIDGETALLSVPPTVETIEEQASQNSAQASTSNADLQSVNGQKPKFPTLSVSRGIRYEEGGNVSGEKNSGNRSEGGTSDGRTRTRSQGKSSSNGSFITSPTEKPSRAAGIPPNFMVKRPLLTMFSNVEDDETNTLTSNNVDKPIINGPNTSGVKSKGNGSIVLPETSYEKENASGGLRMPQAPKLAAASFYSNEGAVRDTRNTSMLPDSLFRYQQSLQDRNSVLGDTFSVNANVGKGVTSAGSLFKEFTEGEYLGLSASVREQVSLPILNRAISYLEAHRKELGPYLTRKALQKMLDKELTPVQTIMFCNALTESGKLLRLRSNDNA